MQNVEPWGLTHATPVLPLEQHPSPDRILIDLI